MDTKKARNARGQQLTARQHEIIVGSLLGDGCLTPTTRGFAFRVNHGMNQAAYVDWKYRELENLTNSPPQYCGRSYYFRTVSHPYFDRLRQHFYVEKRKVIPAQLTGWMSPLVLSVWVMDDGARDGRQLRINTQSFSRDENEQLIHILMAKLGIAATLNRDKDRLRLRVCAASVQDVRQIVAPYMIPSMHYKLSR
jgi:recombination protein RecA